MTTHKASFTQKNQQQIASEGTQIEGTTMGLAPSQEQMTAFLYDLLSPEESALLEQRVSESDSYREALQSSRQARALFACWDDVPAPDGLAERALQMIQSAASSSSSSSSSPISSDHSSSGQ